MYSTYSQFQQFQLSTQPYQDTQRTWLPSMRRDAASA